MSKEHSWGWCKRLVFGLLVALVPVMFGLGMWQLQRAEHKQQILERWDTSSQTLYELPVLSSDSAENDGRSVALQGQLLPERFFFLDNRVRQGQAGYEVLVVLDVKASPQYALLNLGWLAANPDRTQLPKVELPDGYVDVAGRLLTPVSGFTLSKVPRPSGWPQRIQQIDLADISAVLELELYPQVVRMDAPLLTDIQVGWAAVNMPPERHIGYAFQWFMMSCALVVCLIVFGWRRERIAIQLIAGSANLTGQGDK